MYCGNVNRRAVYVAKSDGQVERYTNWHLPIYQEGGNCATLTPSGQWKIKPCLDYYSHLCQYAYDGGDCGDNRHLVGGDRCVSLHTDSIGWYTARAHCQHHGGDLVMITRVDIHRELVQLTKDVGQYFWIGLSSRAWLWFPDTWLMPYLNWDAGQPTTFTGVKESCMTMDTAFRWQATSCDESHYYICHIGALGHRRHERRIQDRLTVK